MVKEKSIGAVVFRQNSNERQFILLHYNSGHWGFPKGHPEPGESDEQTLKREVKEETGLTQLNLLPGFKHITKYFFKRGKQTVFKQVVFYLAESGQCRAKLSFEHQGFEWLPFEKAMQRLSFKNTREVLGKARDFLRQQNEKEH